MFLFYLVIGALQMFFDDDDDDDVLRQSVQPVGVVPSVSAVRRIP